MDAHQRAWQEHMSRRELGSGKALLDLRCNGASGSTMVWTGKCEGPVTAEDIITHFGDGVFGHRGPVMAGGRFTYTLITD